MREIKFKYHWKLKLKEFYCVLTGHMYTLDVPGIKTLVKCGKCNIIRNKKDL